MSLRMHLRRVVIMMIIEFAVPSLALNYPCKKYQIIYEGACFTFICAHEKQMPMQEWICMKCPHTSHVEVDQFLNSQHAWACWDMVARRIVFEIPQTDSQMYIFPDQLNRQICPVLMDSKFHSKLRVLDTDDVKHYFFVFCSGKTCLVLFQGCCSFVVRHLCPVDNTPITTILATHLLHEFIVTVTHRMDWSYRKPYICLSFNFWKQYPADGIYLRWFDPDFFGEGGTILLWSSLVSPPLLLS